MLSFSSRRGIIEISDVSSFVLKMTGLKTQHLVSGAHFPSLLCRQNCVGTHALLMHELQTRIKPVSGKVCLLILANIYELKVIKWLQEALSVSKRSLPGTFRHKLTERICRRLIPLRVCWDLSDVPPTWLSPQCILLFSLLGYSYWGRVYVL